MKYAEAQSRLAAHRKEIATIREQMRKLQLETEPQAVVDYTFQTLNGPVRLKDLFGDKNDLIVIHNMGASCRYCTLRADGSLRGRHGLPLAGRRLAPRRVRLPPRRRSGRESL